jgi:hypothetical protein
MLRVRALGCAGHTAARIFWISSSAVGDAAHVGAASRSVPARPERIVR